MNRHRGLSLALALGVVSIVIAGQSAAGKRTHTVTITSGPQGTVASTDAGFSYSSSARATFTCAIDGDGPSSCGTGFAGSTSYSGLATGGHTFLVTATVSSRDVAQARRSWNVAPPPPPPPANRPPSASFTYSPPAPKAGEQVVFTSTSSDPDGVISNNEWDLDGDNTFGEAGEPAGPTATTASRSFADAGSYTVRLRVTDNAGAQAVAAQTVTVAIPPAPKGPQRVPMSFHRGRLHGPFVLTADAVRRIPRRTRVPEGDVDQELDAPPAPCARPLCGTLDLSEAKRLTRLSPPLTTPAFTCCRKAIDPQIAASSGSYLVAGFRNFLQFYDKAGQGLTEKCSFNILDTTCDSLKQIGAVQLCDLFAPMIPAVNASFPLPRDKKDGYGNLITPENGYGVNCDKKTGGTQPANWKYTARPFNWPFYWPSDSIYDARVLWDEYHKRFWIAALMINTNTEYANDGKPRPSSLSADVAHARRAFLAIAASKTEDPRDGWYLYWTEGFPAQAKKCPNECRLKGKVVGGGSDYLQMGISGKDLVVVGGAGFSDALTGFNESTQVITVISTDSLQASGTKLLFYYQTEQPLKNPDGSDIWVNAKIPAAVQHRPDLLGQKLLFTTQWVDPGREDSDPAKYTVLLWTLSLDTSTPTLYRQPIPVRPFGGIKGDEGAPQQGSSTTNLFVAQNWVNALVYRKGNLYLVFDERTVDKGEILSALRFLRIHLNGSVKSKGTLTWNLDVAVDRTFGGRNILDPQGKKAWYGFPSVEVNKKGDAALVYHRSAAWLYPEARYSVYFLKEKDIRPSRVLRAGNSPIAAGKWHHYVGTSVDGFDNTGIWMINGYAKNGRWAYAIGKVLGKTFADLEPGVVLKGLTGSAKSGKYRVSVGIANLGDGAAGKTRARLSLTRTNGPHAGLGMPLGTIPVPKVGSGRRTMVAATVQVPGRALGAGYRYLRVGLDSTKTLREYGEKNNVVYTPLP